MSIDYIITLQDVRAYLDTLGPDEEAGIVGDAFNCPVARAGQWKYGGIPFVATVWHVGPKDWQQLGIRPEEPSNEIIQFIRAVDRTGDTLSPISRSQVEGATWI